MFINSFLANNQDLTLYLAQLECRMTTCDFFKKLRDDERLDPMNFQVRETWLRVDDWFGEYMVVFGRHFSIRACQRVGLNFGVIDAVMRQLSNNEVLYAVTSHPLYWEKNKVVRDDGDKIRAVAVLEEDTPFACIYECGQSYVYPRTILEKRPTLHFHEDTAVIMVNRDGFVTHK